MRLNVSKKTAANYKSDIKNFFAWYIFSVTNNKAGYANLSLAENLLNVISTAHITGYITNLLESATPATTINRRLSALRLFFKYAIQNQICTHDPTESISNLKKNSGRHDDHLIILSEFTEHLQSEGASSSTIRGYVADIKHLLVWVKQTT
ncbi:hypothetical protein A2154_05335 [Candidatus Gottesmanbacteria bacterium RBG_16_43_7]|uniref:Core-binding (CB) domain-containing protein n=1 Tax=Candidatus Gottesmanbacteria bacterium RBG_16_43_7 TaxID=1798373 RepID=A0A1F5ZBI0_9BACT|nr:MAG: hypothetical protein A2154_05335 [Candidatus Gottesmanbacteria bacterium RBG_16_43_7]